MHKNWITQTLLVGVQSSTAPLENSLGRMPLRHLQNNGVRGPDHAILANLLFPCSYQLQYCCLENPMDRETWWATVHRVRKSRT